jgi:hypothetical protein
VIGFAGPVLSQGPELRGVILGYGFESGWEPVLERQNELELKREFEKNVGVKAEPEPEEFRSW